MAGIAPEIDLNIQSPTTEEIETSFTYNLDFNTGRIIGTTEGISAIEQFVEKSILTARDKFLIYNGNYGSEISAILSSSGSESLLETELTRVITEALIYDERIINVRDFEFNFQFDEGYVTFTVDTIFGEIEGVTL